MITDLSITGALMIDVATLFVCTAMAIRVARSILHPAWMFLGIHLYIVTFRLLRLQAGGSPMKSVFAWPVTLAEVTRASVLCDLAMLSMAAGWIVASKVSRTPRRTSHTTSKSVSARRVLLIAAVSFVMGVLGIHFVGRFEQQLNSTWQTSGYMSATVTWTSWSICLIHYIYGFPKTLLAISSCVLVAVAITTPSRFAIIIPVIFLLLLWFARNRGGRLPVLLLPALLAVVAIWLPMKPFTHALHNGSSLGDASAFAISSTANNFASSEGSIDEQFLDMIAATITLADLHGEWYWGGTIKPLLVSPVPRLLWPEKPRLNQFQWDLQVPSRNIADIGMTAGLVAEAYVNMGTAGIVLISLLVSFGYTAAYYRVAPTGSVHPGLLRSPGLLLYLIFLSSCMQCYRDGLVSMFWFPFVYAAPISAAAASHWLWPNRGPGTLTMGLRRRWVLPTRSSSRQFRSRYYDTAGQSS